MVVFKLLDEICYRNNVLKRKTMKNQPNKNQTWQQITFLPNLAEMIDGMLEASEENNENLLDAKERPHSMDDFTVSRLFEVYGKQKEDFWLYDEQLKRWGKSKLTAVQSKEVKRLKEQIVRLKRSVDIIWRLRSF